MAFVHGDTFAKYGTTVSNLQRLYSALSSTSGLTLLPTGGRFGGYALRASARLPLTLPSAQATVTQGVSCKPVSLPAAASANTTVFRWLDGATVQCSVHILSDGSVLAYRGDSTALLGSAPAGTFSATAYPRLEAQAVIHNTAGAVTVKIDDVTVLSLSGVNTRASAANQATQVTIGGIGFSVDFCDWTVTDGSGTSNTGFLGDLRGACLTPDGAGTYGTSDAPTGAATRHEAVDETTPDDDTSYNGYSAAGQKNTYALAALPAGAQSVVAVQVVSLLRKDDAGTNTARLLVRSGSTDSEGADIAVGTSYAYARRVVETDPATGAAWTVAAVNALEIGVKRQA